MNCPFCGLYPYEMVDVGVGCVPVAVNCCEHGGLLFDHRTDPALQKIATEIAEEIGEGIATDEQLGRLHDRVVAAIAERDISPRRS